MDKDNEQSAPTIYDIIRREERERQAAESARQERVNEMHEQGNQ